MDPNYKKMEYAQNEKIETKKSEISPTDGKNSKSSRLNKSNVTKSSSQAKIKSNSASFNNFNNQSDLQVRKKCLSIANLMAI
jgi:hypothetical protein